MPPCAAILWARRGESWKQKQWTLQPSSARLAAALPPARPEPTTIMVYFRLLAGFTSLRLKRWRSHRVSIGPVGHFELSSMLAFLSYLTYYLTRPTITATGMEQLPMAIRMAKMAAPFFNFGV